MMSFTSRDITEIVHGCKGHKLLSHITVVLCVYRDCHGWSSIIAIHKDIVVFTFSFNLNLSSKDIKVENMQKSNCMQKIE